MREAKLIFDQAVELPPDQRDSFIETACGRDADLRSRVESLLEEFESGGAATGSPFVVRPSAAQVESAAFKGTARFSIQRELGAGAFGTVYQAWDREQQTTVALKVLHSRKADLLFRFKREFRAVVNLRHQNLVRLYELFSEGDQWFFSMELIEGENFLDYVRPDGGPCDIARLRSSLGQLVDGIDALHAARRLHRDLKPANVLVTKSGRVVVLDFGLVREFDSIPGPSVTFTQMIGTPAYMSPEQALNGKVTEASDWYSIGVMLFQALTGRLPHAESALERWINRSAQAAPAPRQLSPDAPDDLNELCRGLLQTVPEDRPDPALVPGIISKSLSLAQDRGEADPHQDSIDNFVGRGDQLRELEQAFAETREGRFTVLLMQGRSGIGKSALVRQFLRSIANQHPSPITLQGRCYEFESVPYKGLDALVDELCSQLQGLPDSRVEALLPRDASLLPKLFPVLGRIKAIVHAPARSILADAQELRQRTFGALRELLARLSDRQPLIVWIDDLQWGDRDTATFLAELCAPPSQPPLLLILSYRSEEMTSNSTLLYLQQVFANQRLHGNWRQLELGELTNAESHLLLDRLLPGGHGAGEPAHLSFVKEAAGHPLFLQQLVQFATSRGDLANGSRCDLDLKQVIKARFNDLPSFGKEILEFICIASQPLSVHVLFAAAGGDPEEGRSESLALLVRAKLIRSSSTQENRNVEPFHDQVRTAVVEAIPSHLRRERHARLAEVLESQPEIEPQVLVKHYQEAGNLPAVYHAACRAAKVAEGQLAFDRAALFYQSALDTIQVEPERQTELLRKLANTLNLAGRGWDAAHAYLKAAECGPPDAVFELQRLAADQFVRSGYIDEGLSLFERVAATLDLRVPRTPGQAVRGILWARLRTRVRLSFGIPTVRTRVGPSRELAQLELLRTGAVVLNIADPVLAAYFQAQYVLRAVRHREIVHLAIGLAIESSIRLVGGRGDVAGALRMIDIAERLAGEANEPHVIGLIKLLRPYNDYLLFRIQSGTEHGRRAITFLRDSCTGVAWEITGCYVLLFWFMCWSGQTKEVREKLPHLLKDAATRGDVNMEVSLRLLSYVHYSYLSFDQPHECIRECEAALLKWSKRGYHLQHYGAMFALVESYLYIADYPRARERLLADWTKMSASFILRWHTLLVMALFLRGRVALACWLDRPEDAALRAEVKYYVKRLQRVRAQCGWGMATSLQAGLAAGERRWRDAARDLEKAAYEFDAASLYGYASAAKHLRWCVEKDERGRVLEAEGRKFVQEQDIINPDAFWSMLLPGRWFSQARLRRPSLESDT